MTPANCPAVTPASWRAHLYAPPAMGNCDDSSAYTVATSNCITRHVDQRGKPATPRHHSLDADNGVKSDDWRNNRETKGKAIPDAHAAMKLISSSGRRAGNDRGNIIRARFYRHGGPIRSNTAGSTANLDDSARGFPSGPVKINPRRKLEQSWNPARAQKQKKCE